MGGSTLHPEWQGEERAGYQEGPVESLHYCLSPSSSSPSLHCNSSSCCPGKVRLDKAPLLLSLSVLHWATQFPITFPGGAL